MNKHFMYAYVVTTISIIFNLTTDFSVNLMHIFLACTVAHV